MVILIPSYQPKIRLNYLVEELIAVPGTGVVVIDDGSGERYEPIFDYLRDRGCTVLKHPVNRGKGAALKTGLDHLKRTGCTDAIVTADSDGQHLKENTIQVGTAAGCSERLVILGSRAFAGKVPIRSRVGNSLTRGVFYLSTGIRIRDTQTGLGGFGSDLLEWLLEIQGERFEYEMNMLLEAVENNVILKEIDIEKVYLERNAHSYFRPLVDSAKVYLPLLRFSLVGIVSAVIDFSMLFILQRFVSNLFFSVVGARHDITDAGDGVYHPRHSYVHAWHPML